MLLEGFLHVSAIFLRTKASVFPILPKQPWAIYFGLVVRASCLDTGEGTNCEVLPEPSLEVVAAAAMCHIIGSNFPSSSYVYATVVLAIFLMNQVTKFFSSSSIFL